MAATSNENLLYLNLENRWPQLRRDGLEIGQDGVLRLAHVPNAGATQTITLPLPEKFDSPAGAAADLAGNIYLSEPATNLVFKYDVCTNRIEAIPCLAGNQNSRPMFNRPRGLWIGPENLLWVADSGNHRVVAIDPATWQIRRILGHPDSFVATPSAEPGRLNDPRQLSRDRAGNFYVVDFGNRRVQKFDRHGNVQPDFWETLFVETQVDSPSDLAIATFEGEEVLVIINQKPLDQDNELLIIDTHGHLWRKRRWPIISPTASLKIQTSGLVVDEMAVYIGDLAQQTVLKFHWDGKFIGSARHYHGPVAALGFDRQGRLLVHPGEAAKLIRMTVDQAFLAKGFFLAGPYAPAPRPVQWHRLRVEMDALPDETHVQFYVYTSNNAAPPPYDPNAENPFVHKDWQLLPRDLPDALIPSRPAFSTDPVNSPVPRIAARYLWLGATLRGDELTSPALRQIRLDYEQENLLRHLPPVYASEPASRDFLERFLSLFAGSMERVEDHIRFLPALFDPYAAPPQFLPALAQWVAMDLEEDWSEQQKRDAIAKTFQLHALRGTAQGLVEYLELYTPAAVHIDEPILYNSLWSLPAKLEKAKSKNETQAACWVICPPPAMEENAAADDAAACLEEDWTNTNNAILGFTTMLAPAHAQGAVVGATATLDQSHLIAAEDFGAPLFEDLANFFYVLIGWNGRENDAEVEKIRTIIEREKPAHTAYHLCVMEPKMRVGFQARVGIDTYIAGAATPMRLSEHSQLGNDAVLSGFAREGSWLQKTTATGIKTTLV